MAEKAKVGHPLEELLQESELPTNGRMRLRVSWSMGDIVIFVLGWGVLTIVTLGIAALFLPYAVLKRVLDNAQFYDEDGVARTVLERTTFIEQVEA
ncbi:MAG: hypothetical protein OXG02_06060 [Chloroflexi bacterium]|nr:hypothetical protein [Chloroflexota bacterium]MCY4106253.1 hypothetical protein [Chloroflexota bacterium]